MEKKDFPKAPKSREIFVYTCEWIAEPLLPLGYKYRKGKMTSTKKTAPLRPTPSFNHFIQERIGILKAKS